MVAEDVAHFPTMASKTDFDISLSQEPGLGTDLNDRPVGTSNAVANKSTTLTGTPSQSKYFTDDIGDTPYAGSGAGDAVEVTRIKAGTA